MSRIRAFTLIELLIVIAIIAILGSATVLVLNPVELIRQGRDGTRIQDVENIQKSIAFTLFSNPTLIDSLSVTNIYLSLPSGSCPSNPPSGYAYVCNATAVNINKIDGTGWIPLSLQNIAALPTDPNQGGNANDYYAFIANPVTKTFVVTSLMESEKQTKNIASKDGGSDSGRFEKGNVSLWIGASGLVGYWPMDGSGSVANGQTAGLQDISGNNNNGTATNTNGIGMSFVAGKIGNAVQLDGMDDYVTASGGSSMIPNGATNISASAWITKNSNGSIAFRNGPIFFSINGSKFGSPNEIYTTNGWKSVAGNATLSNGVWYYLTLTYDGTNIKNYINGVLDSTTAHSGVLGSMPLNCLGMGIETGGGCGGTIWSYLNGTIDDLRIYNRPLTPDEIASMYNAYK